MLKPKKNITVDDLAAMVAQGFNSIDKRFDGVDGRLKSLEDGQEEIKIRLDNVPYKFEMKELEKRVSFIEKKTGIHYH